MSYRFEYELLKCAKYFYRLYKDVMSQNKVSSLNEDQDYTLTMKGEQWLHMAKKSKYLFQQTRRLTKFLNEGKI